jgi:hypothetical protein
MIDNKTKELKAAAKGAANAASGFATAAAGQLASSFENLKGSASDILSGHARIAKGLKDTLGIPDIPKIPKIPAFKELKKFKPKTPPEPKAFQTEEDYRNAKSNPLGTIYNKGIKPQIEKGISLIGDTNKPLATEISNRLNIAETKISTISSFKPSVGNIKNAAVDIVNKISK